MLIGSNGILKQAVKAKEKTESSGELERVSLAVLQAYTSKNKNIDTDALTEGLVENGFTVSKVENGNTINYLTKVDTGWHFQGEKALYYITSQGNVQVIKDRTSLNIGDYVEYYPDNNSYELDTLYTGVTTTSSKSTLINDSLKWRILSINDDGTVDLISETPSSIQLKFRGDIGYNNGVTIINQICKSLYSNSKINAVSKSLSLDYIEHLMSDKGMHYKNNYSYRTTVDSNFGNAGTIIQFGKAYTYTTNRRYPLLYAEERLSGINSCTVKQNGKGISDEANNLVTSKSTAIANEIITNETGEIVSDGLTITQTLYNINFGANNTNKYMKNDIQCELIFGTNTDYWLASRFAACLQNGNSARFGLYSVMSEQYVAQNLYFSTDSNYTSALLNIRPIVTIDANLEIEADKNYNGKTEIHSIPLLK